MSHALTVLPLRATLAAFRMAQPGLPGRHGTALRRAMALRLAPAEREVEAAVDAFRQRLRRSSDTVEVVDYGAGTRGGARPPERRVAEVYRRAATGPAWGRFLFGLTRGLQPKRVLELGTNLGIGSAHLAGALALTETEGGPAGRLVTLEGAPALAALAGQALARLGHLVGEGGRVEVRVGPFVETLPDVLRGETFDLVFIDGHHEAQAALDYLGTIRPALAPGAVVILDDVEPGRPVRQAWNHLRAASPQPAFYLGKYGLLVTPDSHAGGAATADARENAPISSASADRPSA